MPISEYLLKKIFDKSNSSIFHLDVLPWKEENINENILTALKRRIDVSGFKSLLKYEELDYNEKNDVTLLIKEGLVISIEGYLVSTEYGMIFLNYIMSDLNDSEAFNISTKKLIEIINLNLDSRCKSVFASQISNKEAVLGLFILFNGSVNEKNKFKLIPSENGGYLYGSLIIREINSIYSSLFKDEELTLVKDEKEFRNILGRNGKNGRFAKVFPDNYHRDSDSIWFDFTNCENVLFEYRMAFNILLDALTPKMSKQSLINNLLPIIEKYMISNPLEPYIVKEIFNDINNFETLLKMHAAVKSLLEENFN